MKCAMVSPVGSTSAARCVELGRRVAIRLEHERRVFLASTRMADHLSSGQPIHPWYLRRHRIETVHRIRLTARTDALSLARLIDENYDAAREWARYVCEELSHDRMFVADLKRLGVSERDIGQTPPFQSTRRLLAWIDASIKSDGALAAIAYSLVVEWNSDRTSPSVLRAVSSQFGAHVAVGLRVHVQTDVREDHYVLMLRLAAALCRTEARAVRLIAMISDVSGLLREYFDELALSSSH